jgi:hypothetical protein
VILILSFWKSSKLGQFLSQKSFVCVEILFFRLKNVKIFPPQKKATMRTCYKEVPEEGTSEVFLGKPKKKVGTLNEFSILQFKGIKIWTKNGLALHSKNNSRFGRKIGFA